MRCPALILIAKTPAPGRVKTRLCPPCIPAQAAQIARTSLEQTLAAMEAVEGVRCFAAVDGDAGWVPPGFRSFAQCDGELGNRLAHAFATVDRPAFLIGMDSPTVTPRQLHAAVTRLSDHDSAIGLCSDGGYWGIGLRRPDRAVFDGIEMSRSDTGERQLARLRTLGHQVAVLDRVDDFDTFEAALALAVQIPDTPFARLVTRVADELATSSPPASTIRPL